MGVMAPITVMSSTRSASPAPVVKPVLSKDGAEVLVTNDENQDQNSISTPAEKLSVEAPCAQVVEPAQNTTEQKAQGRSRWKIVVAVLIACVAMLVPAAPRLAGFVTTPGWSLLSESPEIDLGRSQNNSS